MSPLNPILFRNLKTVFGAVGVTNQGVARCGNYYFDCGKRKFNQTVPGEHYTVNCLFCRLGQSNDPDRGKHLSISHMWCVPDDTGTNTHLVKCLRKECMADPEKRRQLQNLVLKDFNHAMLRQIVVRAGTTPKPLPDVVDWPGECLELKYLEPNHPAIVYLRSRGMDPLLIAERYGVRFCICPHADYPACSNRLIIPIIQNAKMVTWQARYTGELNWKETAVPKYFNQPGGRKSHCLYGMDLAKASPIVTVVESAPTVWWLDAGTGTSTVAILGKKVSDAQLNMLKTNWKAAIIALDDNAYLESEDAWVRLKDFMPVVRLTLKKGQDVGKMPHDEFWDLVLAAAVSQGVKLFG